MAAPSGNDLPEYQSSDLPVLLPVYYKRLFPFGPYYRWLRYGGVPKDYFNKREFSFTLKDDVYVRYQSFADQADMEKEVQKNCPYKIDIGAVFSHRPKEHNSIRQTSFQAMEKELVFDIDMTDYDDVRACCQGADICARCWPLMTIAIKILDRALRDDFGFEHLLWVYSGRRGVHCWVADAPARKLNQAARSAIAEYLSLVKGGENQTKKVHLSTPFHPSIEKASQIISEHFEAYALGKQDILANEDSWRKVLALVPDQNLRNTLSSFMAKGKSSVERWELMRRAIKEECNRGSAPPKCFLAAEEVMFQYCYPRLDVNVSKGVNHLLKSPFCIHPKTGRVCVPIDPQQAQTFDPMAVPNLSQLCREIDECQDEENSSPSPSSDENTAPNAKRQMKDYKQTSLMPAVKIFERFVEKLESTWRGKLLEQSDMKKEF